MAHRRKTRICREGWYYLMILAFIVTGGAMREINLLLLMAGVMLGPLVFNYRAATNTLTGLRVRRKLPHAVCAGDLLIVDVSVENTRPRRASHAVRIADRISRVAEQSEAEVLFPEIKPGEKRHRSYQGRLAQRGRYEFGPINMSTRFPLGLVRQTAQLEKRETLTVYPRLGRLTPAWHRVYQESMLGSRRTRRRQSATDGDFLALRDWQAGDSRRWIHWRTSARRGRLVVRQFEQQQSQDLLLLLDLWQPERPTEDHFDNVELAVSFAATVANDLCRRGGSQLDVGIAGGELLYTHGDASAALQTEIMENLAIAEATSEDRMPELLRETMTHSPAGTLTLLISTRPGGVSLSEEADQLESESQISLATRRVVPINASCEELAIYFRPD